LVFYVDQADVESIVADYRCVDNPDGSVILMVIPEVHPDNLRISAGKPVPAAVAFVDMLSSLEVRQRRYATRALDKSMGRVSRDLQP
jgi:hypothetical protein